MYERFFIVTGSCLAYVALFFINNFLFGALEFSEGVNWVYLPSGFRLMLVLVFVGSGATGVALASMLVSYMVQFDQGLFFTMAIGLISGFAPYIARHICHDKLGMDLDLRNLTAQKLIAISVVFATVSASMHQVFFAWQGVTENFIASTVVMTIGDLLGTIIMLYIAKAILSWVRLKPI